MLDKQGNCYDNCPGTVCLSTQLRSIFESGKLICLSKYGTLKDQTLLYSKYGIITEI